MISSWCCTFNRSTCTSGHVDLVSASSGRSASTSTRRDRGRSPEPRLAGVPVGFDQGRRARRRVDRTTVVEADLDRLRRIAEVHQRSAALIPCLHEDVTPEPGPATGCATQVSSVVWTGDSCSSCGHELPVHDVVDRVAAHLRSSPARPARALPPPHSSVNTTRIAPIVAEGRPVPVRYRVGHVVDPRRVGGSAYVDSRPFPLARAGRRSHPGYTVYVVQAR